jgi:hypothetical protein
MKITTHEEYEMAKKRFAKLFHADSCTTNYEESQELLTALDEFENKISTKITESQTNNLL